MRLLLTSFTIALQCFVRISMAGTGPLEPRGEIHIPIGLPDSRDTLKTFVEAEGNFSPGFASCGVSYWIFDPEAKRFFAPTQDDVKSERGFAERGILIPWTRWRAGAIEVHSEVCQVQRATPQGDAQIVGARVHVKNTGAEEKKVTLYAVVTPLGAAGAPIYDLQVEAGAALINRQPVLISESKPDGAEAPAPGDGSFISPVATLPENSAIKSRSGKADGALRFEVALAAGAEKTFGFICPVLPGRRAAAHFWDGASPWAQLDDADPIIGSQGIQQPALPTEFYRAIGVDALFAEAEAYWRRFRGEVQIELPDPRWAEAFHAIPIHEAMCLNEGAPDVAVINYNVFNRDGVYVANVLDKSGNAELAAKVIDYFLQHPFNGRVQPEADNPGQLLWVLGEHWLFTRDRGWLERVWPSVQKLSALIAYCRTTPEPHWVSVNGIGFGDDVPDGDRMRLRPGACDGHHPEYTDAFDIAGLHAAAELAKAMNEITADPHWSALAENFTREFDAQFGPKLREHAYANYSVLWPCHVYPFGEGRGFEAFRSVGAQEPNSWRYFPLALAHQGLLAGNRDAAAGTLARHLELPSMHGWYALDEGGPSAPGNWMKVETNWKLGAKGPNGALSAPAMPHGWSIAEFHLLLRDALVFEDRDRAVLFAGVPAEWFSRPMRLRNVPTHFGLLSVEWMPDDDHATLRITNEARPPGGFIVRMPDGDHAVADPTQPLSIKLK